MGHAEVTDLYEAAYLVTEGCRVEGVRCIPLSSSVGCCLVISGSSLTLKRETFHKKEAAVNLNSFRNAYTQVNGLVHEAKKAWVREQRSHEQRQGREVGL
jgi:hypothetical protein